MIPGNITRLRCSFAVTLLSVHPTFDGHTDKIPLRCRTYGEVLSWSWEAHTVLSLWSLSLDTSSFLANSSAGRIKGVSACAALNSHLSYRWLLSSFGWTRVRMRQASRRLTEILNASGSYRRYSLPEVRHPESQLFNPLPRYLTTGCQQPLRTQDDKSSPNAPTSNHDPDYSA